MAEGKKLQINVGVNFGFLHKNYDPNKKEKQGFCLEGSGGSGKTYDVLQFIIYYCEIHANKNKDILITRESYADCQKTVLKDFLNILKRYGLYDQKCHRESHPQKYVYKGNTISFAGLNDSAAHGDRRNFIYFNELLLSDDDKAYKQLQSRCSEVFIADWNPIYTIHWAYDQLLNRPDVKLFKSTFRTNPYLPKGERDEKLGYEPTPENIAAGTADEYMWRVYGLGERAAREGTIFRYVNYIDEFPNDVSYWYGMDFGYTCFDGDTFITTINGQKKIKDITSGTLVLTRNGYKKVVKVFKNGIKEVEKKRLHFDNYSIDISATQNHNFNINGKWKKYVHLAKADKLFVLSNLTGNNTEDTLMVNTPTITTSNIKSRVFITAKYFMSKCGDFIMEKCQKVRLFIMSILTHLIIQLLTLSLLLQANTLKFMAIFAHIIKLKEQNILSELDFLEKIGAKEGKKLFNRYKTKSELAFGVAVSLFQLMFIKGFVLKNVITNGNMSQKKIIQNFIASFVEKHLSEINIQNQNHALISAQAISLQVKEVEKIQSYKCQVYDLWVEQEHEYFANGILVHNCDPTTLAKVYIDETNKQLYAENLMYESTENPMLINDYLNSIGTEKYLPIIADSSDKYISQTRGAVEMVKELKAYGWNISKVSKTHDRYYWINKAKEYKLNIVASPKRSELAQHTKREFENFMWRTVNGIQVNQPVDKFDHFISAMLYAMMGNKSQQRRSRVWGK